MTELANLSALAYSNSWEKGFWDDKPEDSAQWKHYVGNKLMLIVGEVSEAHESLRRGEMTTFFDAKGKPEGLPAELADVFIRLFDLCGALKIDIASEIDRKMAYNKTRERLHGKQF